MSMPNVAPNVPRHRHRVRVFVDFWNYELSMKARDPGFKADWSRLGPVLSRAAAQAVDAASKDEYQGLNFYGSYNRSRSGRHHDALPAMRR